MSNEEVAINIIAYDNASKVMLMVAKSLNVVKEASLTINKAFDVTGSALASKLQGAGVYKGSFLDPKYADAFTDAVFNMQQKSNRYLNSVYDSIMKTGKLQFPTAKARAGFKDIDDVLKDVDLQIKSSGRQFQGWAMSIMFFGMAIQKTMDSIWKESTKTFQDISHSVEGTTTGFDMLEGSMKYLGFTIGSALEPIAVMLIPIVDKVADWVTQHEALTGKIVSGGLALGAIFAAGGGGALAINGFLDLSDRITTASKGAIGVKEQLAGMVATGYAIDMAVNLVEGDLFGAAASGFESFGLWALMAGKGTAGAVLFSIGAALDIIDAIVDGKGKLTTESLAGLLMQLAPGLLMFNPAAGAAVLTIGLGLTLLPDQFKNDFVAFLGTMFGVVAVMVAAVIDAILFTIKAPINVAIDVINGIISILNKTRDASNQLEKLDKLEQWTLTTAAIDRLKNVASEVSWAGAANESDNNMSSNTTQVNNDIVVMLDGENVTEAVISRINESTRRGNTFQWQPS